MSELHPIIMTGQSVVDTMERRKIQTRRAMNPQPPSWANDPQPMEGPYCPFFGDAPGIGKAMWTLKCPYGAPGHRLWVKEVWGLVNPGGWACDPSTLNYRADGEQRLISPSILIDCNVRPREGWRSPIFMPQWASRLLLEVELVRPQRLNQITEADALEEGITETAYPVHGPDGTVYHLAYPQGTLRGGFQARWDSLNVKRYPAHSNPWVWAITYRLLERRLR